MATTYPVTRWQIGAVRVTRVIEIEGPSPGTFLFEDATPERLLQHAWLQPHFLTPDGRTLGSIHAFVIESEGRRIVVDTCVGNDKVRSVKPWHLRKGRFLEDLAAASFPRESIDTVLCTHLHVDHVGWNTVLHDGRWMPTFPNARYLFAEREWAYWSSQPPMHDGDVQGDSVAPIVEAGLADLVAMDHRITSEVMLEPSLGHTPGHVSVRIRSQDEEAVITGDLMHHPVQCAQPGWASRFDVDPEAARATRRAFLEENADRRVLVLGTHFATPTAGLVVRDGDAWRFDAVESPPLRDAPPLMLFLPSVIVAVLGIAGFAGRDSWWGIIPALLAIGSLGYALALGLSRSEFEDIRSRYPAYTRRKHVLTHVLLYFLLPGIVWAFLGLPFLAKWIAR